METNRTQHAHLQIQFTLNYDIVMYIYIQSKNYLIEKILRVKSVQIEQ